MKNLIITFLFILSSILYVSCHEDRVYQQKNYTQRDKDTPMSNSQVSNTSKKKEEDAETHDHKEVPSDKKKSSSSSSKSQDSKQESSDRNKKSTDRQEDNENNIEDNIEFSSFQDSNQDSSHLWIWFAIIAQGILFIGTISIFRTRNLNEEEIKEIIFDRSRRMRDIRNIILNLEDEHKRIHKEIEQLRILSYETKNQKYQSECLQSRQNPSYSTQDYQHKEKNNDIQSVAKYKYPRAIISGGFRGDLSDDKDDRYFEFFDLKDDKASYRFCGSNIVERVKANITEIESVCEITGFSTDAQKIEHQDNGSVIFNKDGLWIVTKKAKIKFT